MKYFLCNIDINKSNYNCTYLGFPSEYIERIIVSERKSLSVFETEGNDSFVSIPMLLKLKEHITPHGLVLKSPGLVKILLTPKIDEELDIPEYEIKDLPKTFAEFFIFFKGVFFIEKKIIFILDPKKIDKRFLND